MIAMLSYVYAEADAQRRREGGSGREAIRGGSRHLGLSARRALSRPLFGTAEGRWPDAGSASAPGSGPWRAGRCTPPASQPEIPVKRLLLDLNVFLDVVLDRRPDADVAAALWAAIERGQGHGMVPAHGVTTIFYLLEKARDAAFARQGVERLIGVFAVAPVDDNVVRRALALAWPDFEDAVCAAAAEASGCDALVTRDPDGYPNAPLPVIDPAGALSWLTQE